MLSFQDTQMNLTFNRWGLVEYDWFIKSKSLPEQNLKYDWKKDSYTISAPARFAHVFGIEAPGVDKGWLPIADHLFDYQKFIVEQTLILKRMAHWCDCVHGDTVINTTSGNFKIKELSENGNPIEVFSINSNGQVVKAMATCPFRKGRDETIDIETSSGKKITVTNGHVFLTPTGWKKAGDLSVQDLLCVSDSDLLQSNSEPCQQVFPLNALCSMQKDVNYQGGCLPYCRQFCHSSLNSFFMGVLGNNSIYYDTVVSVKQNSLSDFYDLHVPVHENYLANGIWNHNTGLGKTAIFLEIARQVHHRYNQKILIIVPLNIVTQTIQEADKFYGKGAMPIYRIKSREDLSGWCSNGVPGIAIVNPDKFIPRSGEPETISEIRHCNCVILDEASLLRASAGKIKWAIIKSCRGIEYKVAATATPAPNECMEYASQGSFLEKLRSEGEILWTFFKRDKEGNWGIRPYAKDAFYRFMAGWSIYLRSPKNYGFQDNLKDLPEPQFFEYKIKPTTEQIEYIRDITKTNNGQIILFAASDTKLGMVNRIKYSQIAKGFLYQSGKNPISIASEKPEFVANLIKQESEAGHQVIVWTVFDEESEIIKRQFGDEITVISGKTPRLKRDETIEKFRNGSIRVLVSKASLIGHGLNFQHCTSMIFSGFDDSFENYYQAVRRAYRYGQKHSVRIHTPYIPELEGVIWNNVIKKQNQFIHDVTVQELAYKKAIQQIMNGFDKE